MKRGLILLALVLCSIPVVAQEGSITLLAQAQNETSEYGTTAKLSLQIEPGSDRVFLEIFPLSKVTTQASLRFAQQIACSELGIECRNYDFFWRISGVNGIVGGPSAGASAALLASALLMGETLPTDIAATGTINSGGSIGPVAGLNHKIRAAAKEGIKTVFIAPGSMLGNNTNISGLRKELNINIEEAPTLRYILSRIFGTEYNDTVRAASNPDYEARMRSVALGLCERAHILLGQTNNTVSENLTKLAEESMLQGNSYSAASFCFRAAVEIRSKIYLKTDLGERRIKYDILQAEIDRVKEELDNVSLDTITNLQTYMAVRERVDESADLLASIRNLSNRESTVKLAYAEERFNSALAWSAFFDADGENIDVNIASVRQCCINKLEEAHERFNYVMTMLSENLAGAQTELKQANDYLKNENYVMCIYSASKAKALSNMMMDLIGTKEDFLNDTAQLKINIAERSIAESMQKGTFPIMAFSYLQYAKSLYDKEILNSLLYAEEALELSNFDIYFKKPQVNTAVLPDSWIVFLVGFILGAGIVYFFMKKA
ncbi:hypothetical protein KY329_01990 [Candidatus Woesearchaeota archaeon]|nr:hypothetical protein [Candidatus Woesearchaeota archaeon]